MKGEVVDPYTVWCGNPAKLSRRHVAIDRGRRRSWLAVLIRG
jgi:hypothetical protein